MAMDKFEMRVLRPQLLPEAPDPEFALPHIGVVEQHHTASAQRLPPGGEVAGDGLIGVEAVDMQQVDLAGAEIAAGLIEILAQKGGEAAPAGVVQGQDGCEDIARVFSRMRVAFPAIHREAAGRQAAAFDRLA
jgi:hypothetical protein